MRRRDAGRRRLGGRGGTGRADAESTDAGFTLLEVVVVMTIMSIVLVIFTAGISQAYSSEDRVTAATAAESQLTIAFQRLDKEIRYAAWITNPGTVGDDVYVEMLTNFEGVAAPAKCTELRLQASTGLLQQRTWLKGASPTAGSWMQLAFDVTSVATAGSLPSGAVQAGPFTFYPAGSPTNFQRLEVDVRALSGSGETAASKQSDVTFTALDAPLGTPSDTTCISGRATP